MNQPILTPKAATIESQLASPNMGPLVPAVRRQVSRQLADQGLTAANYEFVAVRTHAEAGQATYGPHILSVGEYDENTLYGNYLTPVFQFRRAAERLAEHAQRCLDAQDDAPEFVHQTTLFWSEVSQTKDFLEVADEIDELVAVWRSVRFQFMRRDTPVEVISALEETLAWVAQAASVDLALVDQVVDRLEGVGIDPFVQDAQPRANG